MQRMADADEVLNLTEAYEELRRGEYVVLQTDAGNEGVKIDGMMWLSGALKPLQIVSSRGRRYALGNADRIIRSRERGF